MHNTGTRGELSEIEVTAALMRAGRRVLRPLSPSSRYDLVIDNDDGTFMRVQCKTGVEKNGSIVFRLYSVSRHRGTARGYGGEVDAFGVYCPANGRSYLVPMSVVSACKVMASLRVAPARNGQQRRMHVAQDFVIGEAPDIAPSTASGRAR